MEQKKKNNWIDFLFFFYDRVLLIIRSELQGDYFGF